ncbi:MAG: hypothetical protein PHP23_10280 [Desulfobacterales bacterium]|nr:hypothetical protein [Desulfobacterales bacterium]MDD4072350.1 hypothetical protein [Desulfobacterales bacterium]MDD4392383.1 hypothetical protein [Desulfobacterales bacterium]
MYSKFLNEQIEMTREKLSIVSRHYDDLGTFDLPVDGGFFSKLKESTRGLELKAGQMKEIFSVILNNMGEIIDSLINLTVLYVALFLFQVVLIPVCMLWALFKLVNIVFVSNLETWLINELQPNPVPADRTMKA